MLFVSLVMLLVVVVVGYVVASFYYNCPITGQYVTDLQEWAASHSCDGHGHSGADSRVTVSMRPFRRGTYQCTSIPSKALGGGKVSRGVADVTPLLWEEEEGDCVVCGQHSFLLGSMAPNPYTLMYSGSRRKGRANSSRISKEMHRRKG